jgi:L-asparaginase II
MANPVLVEVTRGPVVESVHRGAVAVCGSGGNLVFSVGDVGKPVFPRSTVKALQQLPLIETGAADRFGFGDAELALSISSHLGEARHVATARSMLAAAGLNEGCLECGPQWPRLHADQAAMNRTGALPTPIHNNCSGKHAGFLCTAVAMGVEPRGYVEPSHPAMRAIIAAVADVTGAAQSADARGTDGCSIPTYAIPLDALARGFARFATGEGLAPARAAAAARFRRAAAAEPFMISGTGGFDTVAMEILGAAAFVKTGAEGVYVAALPDAGLGVALKVDDGATRGAETVMAALLRALRAIDPEDPRAEALEAAAHPVVTDRTGREVGSVRPSAGFSEALSARFGR